MIDGSQKNLIIFEDPPKNLQKTESKALMGVSYDSCGSSIPQMLQDYVDYIG